MKVDLRKRLRLWMSENGMMALIALVLALFVYLTVLELVSNTTTREVPVEVEREPGMALMAIRPASVQVTFRGALNEFRMLDRTDLRFRVRGLRIRADEGVMKVPLNSRSLRGAAGLRVMQIEPPEVEITFDHQGEREFAIEPPLLEGKPFRGHAEVDFSPKTAVVRGARLQLDRLHDAGVRLNLEPVNVDGRVQGFSQRAAILPPADAWMPEIKPDTVTVKIDIRPDNVVREFAEIPVWLARQPGWPAGGVRASPTGVTVRITGWAEALRSLEPQAIRVFAALPDPDGGLPTNPVPLQVWLPPGTMIETVVVEPARVRLEKSGTIE